MSGAHLLAGLLDFRRLDLLAGGDTALHRLDARAKVLVTAAYVITVMSFDRYTVAALMPFAVFPAAMLARGALPPGYLLRKIALVVPVALVIALPNLWFDRMPLDNLGGWSVTGGQVSLASILVRSVLAASAAILLVAVTGFATLCAALERLGMPRALAVQLLFLYRYLTVLGEEGLRMTVAHEQRAGGRRLSLRGFGTLVGRLLLRTWDRAERIHLAMCARGFDGEFRSARDARFGRREFVFVAGWISAFALLRVVDVAGLLGRVATGGAP